MCVLRTVEQITIETAKLGAFINFDANDSNMHYGFGV